VDTIPATQDLRTADAAMTELWTLAMLPETLWWVTWCTLLGPRHPLVRHAEATEEDDQLIVPEPIEADGEHALFA